MNVAQNVFDELVEKGGSTNFIAVVRAWEAIRSILMSNDEETLKYAKKARELADVEQLESDTCVFG